MKLSCDRTSPDYHDVVQFVDQVQVNGARVKYAIGFDTKAGTVTVATQPPREDSANCWQVLTHIVKGPVTITWRSMPKSSNGLIGAGVAGVAGVGVFEALKAEWEEREKMRDDDTPTAPDTQTNVKSMPFKRPMLKILRDELKACIYKHDGQISVAEVIGILEIVKHELIEEHS